MTQKRSMTELEQLSILTGYQETLIESLARRNSFLKRNLISALAWLVLSLTVIASVTLFYMGPPSLAFVFQLVGNLLNNSIVHWTVLTLFMTTLLLFWSAIIWTEIKKDRIK